MVVVQGLGEIGRLIARAARAADMQVVAAVDPAFAGEEVLPGVVAVADLPAGGDLLLHATGSWLADTGPQLEKAVSMGMSVVSTCEELAWPWARYAAWAERLDQSARDRGVTVVGTGVNPGMLMDRLPASLSALSHDIRRVRVERILNPRRRREAFRKKVGLGLGLAEWQQAAATGQFGHVGLRESGFLLAAGLGWEVAAWREDLRPRLAGGGTALGLVHTLWGDTADGRRLELRFEVNAAVAEEVDRVEVDGTPPLHLEFEGGVFGDDATAAAVVQAARVLRHAPQGLISVLELPLR